MCQKPRRAEMEMEEEVVIVGAGIAGLATAVALHRVGIRALVLERSEGLRTTGAAIYLFPNAWLALDALDVAHKLTAFYPALTAGSVTDLTTGSVHQIFSGEGARAVHRKALLEALSEELPLDSIRFSSHVTSIHTQRLPNQCGASLAVAHQNDGTTIKSKVLIGCDGLHSVVAKWLGLSPPFHSGRSAARGLAVYPQGHGLGHSSQQFVNLDSKGGITPLNDTHVYWLVSYHQSGEHRTYDPKTIQKEVLEQHATGLPSVFLDVIRNSDLSSLSWAPLMVRNPWNIIMGSMSKGSITVVGDAMHPMTPDFAQGGGCALEDAVVLGRHIGESYIANGKVLVPREIAGALDGYVKERKWRAAGLVIGSYVVGWVQQGGSKWWRKLLRVLFHTYSVQLGRYLKYDCGRLPTEKSEP